MKENSQSIANNATKSALSDYWVFVIGMVLITLSNFSDLSSTNNNSEKTAFEQNRVSKQFTTLVKSYSLFSEE